MPEMRFRVRWPSGEEENCYSPSLVVRDYLNPGDSYGLADFLARSGEALRIASARVEARYGRPCALALAQARRLETVAATFRDLPDPRVTVVSFQD